MSITDGTVVCALCGESRTGCSLCGEAPLVGRGRAIADQMRREADAERELDAQSRSIRLAAWRRSTGETHED